MDERKTESRKEQKRKERKQEVQQSGHGVLLVPNQGERKQEVGKMTRPIEDRGQARPLERRESAMVALKVKI